MDLQGENVRRMPNSKGYCSSPSFSHSGKKIMYLKIGGISKGSGFFYKDSADLFDVFEVDIETSQETRLTRARFRGMSPPYYFPDDEAFIFSAYGPPRSYPGIADDDLDAIRKKMHEYEKKYGEYSSEIGIYINQNEVYVLRRGEIYINAPYFQRKGGADILFVTIDGKIFFQEHHVKGRVIFEYAKDGNHKSIIFLENNRFQELLKAIGISIDGKLIIAVYSCLIVLNEKEKIFNFINKTFIYRLEDGTKIEIKLPAQPSRIIPLQK